MSWRIVRRVLFASLAAVGAMECGRAVAGWAVSIGPGIGALDAEQRGDSECGALLMHSDGTYEIAYAWQYGGCVSPTYGAFAECYAGPATVCNVVVDLTHSFFQFERPIDFYVWDDGGGAPGFVRCVRPGLSVSGIAQWPGVSRHRIAMNGCCVEGPYWCGLWIDCPNQATPYFVGADLDGPGGCPMTNIAPGLGWPSGWQLVDLVWGTTAALGIGAEVQPCLPVPTQTSSWGSVKRLYR